MMPARARIDPKKVALTDGKISVEEYLALDRVAEIPSEYHDGHMIPIESVSLAHSLISVKLGSCLDRLLLNTPCNVAASPLRVRVSPTKFILPDFLVYGGKPELTDEHQDTITNPKLIVEILSPSTTDYDYGRKFILYRNLPSFEEYLLVSQNEARVEAFHKTAADHWTLMTYQGLDAAVPIESLGITLPLAEIYKGIEFPAIIEEQALPVDVH